MRRILTSCLQLLILCCALTVQAYGAESDTSRVDWPTYRVGVRIISPPTAFMDRVNGETVFRGFMVDVWREVGKIIHANIEFVPVEVDDMRPYYEEGKLDIGYTLEGMEVIPGETFIPLDLTLRNRFYVYKPAKDSIDPDNMTGLRCVTLSDIRRHPENAERLLLSNPLEGLQMVYLSSPLEALELLDRGVVDVFFAPSESTADFLIRTRDLDNVVKIGGIWGEQNWGLSIFPGYPGLADQVRSALTRLRNIGTRAHLYDKWFINPARDKTLRQYRNIAAIAVGGAILVFIVILTWNGTLRRRVERVTQSLRRAEQRSRELIESSPDMIFLVNAHGDIVEANEQARTCLAMPEDGQQANLALLVPKDDIARQRSFIIDIFAKGSGKREFVILGKGDVPQDVEIAGCLLPGTYHDETLACLFARNVTERNRMEEELVQSERLAIIGKMAASFAHEINNPLGIIQAHAEALVNEDLAAVEIEESLVAIQRNATRAGELTTGLLDAAQPKPMTMASQDLVELVDDSLHLLGPRGADRRIDVRVHNGPLRIKGDRRALQLVLVNLLFNAVAATEGAPEEPITIALCADHAHKSARDRTVRLSVHDKGKGIPRHDLPNVFEPFFTSRAAGFGLGLFIARRVVERHGGMIFAESEPGAGACFHMEFPAHDSLQGE